MTIDTATAVQFLALSSPPCLIQRPIVQVPGAVSPGLIQPEHDAEHSPLFTAWVKNIQNCIYSSIVLCLGTEAALF
jgi:hypothetical protein